MDSNQGRSTVCPAPRSSEPGSQVALLLAIMARSRSMPLNLQGCNREDELVVLSQARPVTESFVPLYAINRATHP